MARWKPYMKEHEATPERLDLRRRTFLTLGAAGAASILLPRCTDAEPQTTGAARQVARRVERAGGEAPTPWGR
jgi:hypothetical protein